MQNPPGVDGEPQFNKRLQENVKQLITLRSWRRYTTCLEGPSLAGQYRQKAWQTLGRISSLGVHKWSAFGFQSSKARLVKSGILVSFSVILCKEHTRGRSLETEMSYHKDCWASCIRNLHFLHLFLCQQTLRLLSLQSIQV